jgi:hypothetical protein
VLCINQAKLASKIELLGCTGDHNDFTARIETGKFASNGQAVKEMMILCVIEER